MLIDFSFLQLDTSQLSRSKRSEEERKEKEITYFLTTVRVKATEIGLKPKCRKSSICRKTSENKIFSKHSKNNSKRSGRLHYPFGQMLLKSQQTSMYGSKRFNSSSLFLHSCPNQGRFGIRGK